MLSEEKNVDFSLCFSINTIQLDLKHQRDEPPFGRLLIHTLEG